MVYIGTEVHAREFGAAVPDDASQLAFEQTVLTSCREI
jgi:hypothetical protein